MISASLQSLDPPRLADLRSTVTICIGALCKVGAQGGPTIVTASDQMISFGTGLAADNLTVKTHPIHDNWELLSAGDDMEYVPFMRDQVCRLIGKYDTPTPEQVAGAISHAYDEQMDEYLRVKVLSKYGITVRKFWTEGKRKLTNEVYHHLVGRMESTKKLSCHFLACGFDEFGSGHLCCFTPDSGPISYDEVGFWAIGRGAAAAIDVMAFYADKHSLTKFSSDLSQCIYLVCAAKFMAESTHSGVGRQTIVSISEFEQPHRWLAPVGLSLARKKWEREGAPRVPKKLFQIGQFVCTSSELNNDQERKLIGKLRPIITGRELG